ncbi:MAG: hypothetical protein PVF27_07235, partial [Gemmatimonadales bacterium]
EIEPQDTYDRLMEEVRQYDPTLARKPHVVALTKADLVPNDHPLPALEAPEAAGVYPVSAVAHRGLEPLMEALWQLVRQAEQIPGDETPP